MERNVRWHPFRFTGNHLADIYPEAKSVGLWLKHGWHVAVACVIGFIVLLWILGWQPHPKHKTMLAAPAPGVEVAVAVR